MTFPVMVRYVQLKNLFRVSSNKNAKMETQLSSYAITKCFSFTKYKEKSGYCSRDVSHLSPPTVAGRKARRRRPPQMRPETNTGVLERKCDQSESQWHPRWHAVTSKCLGQV